MELRPKLYDVPIEAIDPDTMNPRFKAESSRPRHPSTRAPKGKGEAESILTDALRALRSDDRDLAADLAERAVEVLRRPALRSVG